MNTEEIEQKQQIKMNLKMEYAQAFFVRTFLISFVLLLISSILCLFMHDYQVEIVTKYFGMEADDFGFLLMFVFGLWKVIIIQFTLIPAIAIFCMRKCCRCGRSK